MISKQYKNTLVCIRWFKIFCIHKHKKPFLFWCAAKPANVKGKYI